MEDDYLLPDYLKKILNENDSEESNENNEKFADRESMIDENRMIKVVNIFLK